MTRLTTAGVAVLAPVLAVAVVLIWQLVRDPFAALPRLTSEICSQTVARERADGREWRRVHLKVDGDVDVGLAISLPDPLPGGPLPVVFVLGGLETGARSVRHLPDAGDNVLVGYDWPIPRRIPRGTAALRSLPELWHRILYVPGELSLALRWVASQPWADAERLSLVGLSLGALAVPAIQRVAAAEGVTVSWTVLGYGGAPLGALVDHHPGIRPDWLRPLLRAAAILLRPLEPMHHLPHLQGVFLVLGGTDDVLIPEHAARRFADLTPEPKSVHWLEGTHLGVGREQEALLAEVIETTFRWLRDQDAVEIPPEKAQARISSRASPAMQAARSAGGSRRAPGTRIEHEAIERSSKLRPRCSGPSLPAARRSRDGSAGWRRALRRRAPPARRYLLRRYWADMICFHVHRRSARVPLGSGDRRPGS